MPVAISDRSNSVRPGHIHGEGLRLVPILGPSHREPGYRVFDLATMPFVKISEICESGSVQQIQVENTLGENVFLMDGQELVGLPPWERARAGLFLALQNPVEVPGVGLRSLLNAAVDGSDSATLDERLAAEAAAVGLDQSLLTRPLNVDLSGGEKKRTEMVQLGVLQPALCILDEVDSGLDVDALGEVARRLQLATVEWEVGILAITHFHRFLVELEADMVHVMVDGRIVATGDADLALQLEQTGYAGYSQ